MTGFQIFMRSFENKCEGAGDITRRWEGSEELGVERLRINFVCAWRCIGAIEISELFS